VESDDVSDQLGAVFAALLQQRLVEQCPPSTLPRIKTQVRTPCRLLQGVACHPQALQHEQCCADVITAHRWHAEGRQPIKLAL